MHGQLKEVALNTPVFRDIWAGFRRQQLHRSYAARREYYSRIAQERGLVYSEAETLAAIRAGIAGRGYSPTMRSPGEIHTFAFVPLINWHRHLLPDLQELGPVTLFDYSEFGFKLEEFYKADNHAVARRKAMNEMVMPAVRRAHATRPIDWVFVYASGFEISASTVRQITDELGIPTVNMCLDDKHSWDGPWMGDHKAGQVDIAPQFDISWTSASVACEWYLIENARPIYMPEGFDASHFNPIQVEPDIPVSFVGGAYGYRPATVRFLLEHGIQVHTFGSGWPESGWAANAEDIFNRSVVNLGMGGIGYSEVLTNVKGRDFEIPAVGGGVYLTSFNPDLSRHYVVSGEILCYRNRDEMLELVRYYLAHQAEAKIIAARGRARCLTEHRWLHRYQRLCRVLGILPGNGRDDPDHEDLPANA